MRPEELQAGGATQVDRTPARVGELALFDNDITGAAFELDANNFSKACLAMANIGMKKAFAESLFNDNKQKADDKVLGYIQKAIDQGDVKGYAKMGEYYMLLYDEDRAKEFYKKACDLGELNSCMKMMENGWF